MLAQCPSCEASFPVVGRCCLPCPFCRELLDIEIIRTPSSALAARSKIVASPPVRSSRARPRRWPNEPPEVSPSAAVVSAPLETTEKVPRSALEVLAEARADARALSKLNVNRPPPLEWSAVGPAVTQWGRTLYLVLRHPRRFFGALKADHWGGAPAFAAVQLGFAVVVGLVQVRPPAFESVAGAMVDVQAASRALAYAGVVAAAFFAGLLVVFHGAAQSAIGRKVRWAGIGRVAAFGLAPLLWVGLPVVGWWLAGGWCMALHVLGLQRMLGIRWSTAMLTAAIPWLAVLCLLRSAGP